MVFSLSCAEVMAFWSFVTVCSPDSTVDSSEVTALVSLVTVALSVVTVASAVVHVLVEGEGLAVAVLVGSVVLPAHADASAASALDSWLSAVFRVASSVSSFVSSLASCCCAKPRLSSSVVTVCSAEVASSAAACSAAVRVDSAVSTACSDCPAWSVCTFLAWGSLLAPRR